MSRRYNSNKEIKKVTDISKNFIEEHIRTITNINDLIWIMDTKKTCIANEEHEIRKASPSLTDEQIAAKARRQYFGAFRSEFAHKFYPELFTKNTDKMKIDDSLTLAIQARLAELNSHN